MIRRATLIAAALHLAAIALLSLAPPPPTRAAPPGPIAAEAEAVTLVSVETLEPPIPRANAPFAPRSFASALAPTLLRAASTSPARGRSLAVRGRPPDLRGAREAAPSDPSSPGSLEAAPLGDPEAWSSSDEDVVLGIAALDAAPGRVRYADPLADVPPAPTRPPRARRITAAESNEAVRSLVRLADKELGLGAPQEGRVALAVQEAGRASGVPSGTRFTVTLRINADGAVSEARIGGDDAGAGAWSETLAQIRETLASAPIPLAPDAQGGVTVVVEAQVLHVFASGTTEAVVMGACPQLATAGGEAQPSFFNIGGTPYLEPPTGLCPLGDTSNLAPKTIQVRTTAHTRYANEAPPPVSSFPRPRPKKLLLTPTELLMKLLHPKAD